MKNFPTSVCHCPLPKRCSTAAEMLYNLFFDCEMKIMRNFLVKFFSVDIKLKFLLVFSLWEFFLLGVGNDCLGGKLLCWEVREIVSFSHTSMLVKFSDFISNFLWFPWCFPEFWSLIGLDPTPRFSNLIRDTKFFIETKSFSFDMKQIQIMLTEITLNINAFLFVSFIYDFIFPFRIYVSFKMNIWVEYFYLSPLFSAWKSSIKSLSK